jgi:hypothetical protein
MSFRFISPCLASVVAPGAVTIFLVGALAAAGATSCGGRAHDADPSADAAADAPWFVTPKSDAGIAPDAGDEPPDAAEVAADADPAVRGCALAPDGTYRPAHPPTCSESQRASRWAEMIRAPILLPNRAGGLDLVAPASSDGWLDDVWSKNCEPSQIDVQPECIANVSWGDNLALTVSYDLVGRRPLAILLGPGYLGTLDFRSADDATSYRVGRGEMLRNGGPIRVPWDTNDLGSTMDELHRALMATFAPTAKVEVEGVTCLQTQKCTVWMQGSTGASMTFRPLGLSLIFESATPRASLVAIVIEKRP